MVTSAGWRRLLVWAAVCSVAAACGRDSPAGPSAAPGGPGESSSRGLIVVSGDDWVLSDTAFSVLPADAERLAGNLARLLAGASAGRLHAYSDFFAYAGAGLRRAIEAQGHTFTVNATLSFDLPTLQTYDALLVGLPLPTPAQIEVLAQYVDEGGRVYVHGGNGIGQPRLVPDAWNPWLSRYGLQMETGFNGLRGAVTVVSSHALFEGVTRVYIDAGHPLSGCCAVATTTAGAALFAVVER